MVSSREQNHLEDVCFQGAHEYAALYAVTVGLQDCGDSCAAAVVADVVRDHVSKCHDKPVQVVSESSM
jgi:hypothetical protein